MDELRRLGRIDWRSVVGQVAGGGWCRLVRAVDQSRLDALEQAAPGPWSP